LNDWVRLGGAFHSSTYYDMEDEYSTAITAVWNDTLGTMYDPSPFGYFNYELKTPWKAIGSVAINIKKKGLITVDIEIIDYASAKFNSDNYKFSNENAVINAQTKDKGGDDNIENIVSDYTHYALKNKLDGVVCSPKEIEVVKKIASDKLIIITPGIRPSSSSNTQDDQKRFMTPKEAIKCGANYLVIGRPITQSLKPLKTLQKINTSLE